MEIGFIEANLSGSALAKYNEYCTSHRALDHTYSNIKNHLKTVFSVGRDADVHQQLIFDRKQRRNKTIDEFLSHLKKLLLLPTLLFRNRTDMLS